MRIAIIGAGAAGCFAAANIQYKEGQEVMVFERTSKVLQKVRVSGGGRCNVTHHCFDVPELLGYYPRGKQLLKKSMYQFAPKDTMAWFESRGVTLKTEADGRIFPITDNSETIIECIWAEMMRQKVQVRYNKSVTAIKKQADGLLIEFADNSNYLADKVLIATGGYPKADQYKWLTDLGHTISQPVPSLFTFNIPKNPITELMGVALPMAEVKIAGTKLLQQGPLLITHWGLSGPAVLKLSAFAARELADRRYEFNIVVNWLGGVKEDELKDVLLNQRREQGKQLVRSKQPWELPKRLWEHMLAQCGIADDCRWGELSAAGQNKLIEKLIRDTYQVHGKTTFKDEFVTCGGVSLNEINPQTMESKLVSCLYFAGETMDVDGITGGFNFQNAWNSGWVAAKEMGREKK